MSLLKNLSIDPTYYCNENCISCRCRTIANQFNEKDEMSLLEYYRLIDEFCELGGEQVSLYGGEPLIKTYTVDILKYSKTKGLTITISTNGILLNNSQICKALVETNVDRISVSIMGTGEKYDYMHGGSFFQLFRKGINNLIFYGRGIVDKISFHVTLQRKNYDQLPNIILLAHKLGVKMVSCQYVSAVSEEVNKKTETFLGANFDIGISHWNLPKTLLLQKENIPKLMESINLAVKLSAENNICLYLDPIFDCDSLTNILTTGNFNPRGKCSMNDIIVMPDGRIGACAMLQHFVIGNIKVNKLVTILKSDKYIKLKNNVESGIFLPICSNCCRHAMFYNGR